MNEFAIADPGADREAFLVYQRLLQLVFQVAKGLIADPALYLPTKPDAQIGHTAVGQVITQPQPGDPIAKLSAFGAVHYASVVVYDAQQTARYRAACEEFFVLDRFFYWQTVRQLMLAAVEDCSSKELILDHRLALKICNRAIKLARNAVHGCEEPISA